MNPIVEINATIMATLVELIKQGGPIALWGMGIWLVLGLVRLGLIVLVVYLVVRLVCQTISNNYKISKEINGQRVQLVSAQVSERIDSCLNHFCKETEVLLKELEKLVNESKKNSQKK